MVSKKLLIEKMIKELTSAKQASNHEHMMQHIASVQSFCEVLLDESSSDSSVRENEKMSDIEIKAMLGETKRQSPLLDDDANGDSIFDF